MSRRDDEIDREIQNHLDLEAEESNPIEARRAFGNVSLAKEDMRAAWGAPRLEQVARDIRHGLRQLGRYPGFSAVAVLTLALGIGAVTAIFSAFYAVLIRPLPYAEADRLVMIWDEASKVRIAKLFAAPAEWIEWRRSNTVFTDLAVTEMAGAALSGGDEPAQVPAQKATANLWTVLGTKVLMGRVFTQAEDDNGAKVVVISYGLWQRRFGGSSDVLGKPLIINDQTYEIIGVLPSDFYYLPLADTEVWLPASFPPWMRTNFGWHDAQVVARLKPGISLAGASESMNALSLQLTAKSGSHRVILTPLREEMAGKTKSALTALLAAAAALLLIACVNLANLLMSRGTARTQEVKIRAALGAGNGRLVAQFLIESLVLAVFGAMGGLALAIPLMRFLQTLLPAAIGPVTLALDWRVLACSVVLASAATVTFGLTPAVRATRAVRKRGLVEGDRGAATTRSHWFQHTLIVAETTLAVALMASGGILIETFQRLSSADLGFRADHVLTFETVLFRYGQLDRQVAFVDAILEKIRTIPGVVNAGASNELPLRSLDAVATFYWIEGQSRKEANTQVAQMRVVTRDYFSTIGATLNEGRWFKATDRRSDTPVAIVNETFARRQFAGGSAIGARFKYGEFDDKGYWYTIVGVVKDIRETALTEAPRPVVYRVQDQADQVGIQTSSFAVRTSVDPLSIVPAVRQAVWSVDPNQAIWQFKTLDSVVDREFATSRQSTALMTAFALLALVLASLGLYGVLSYSVSERTGEIGVRMALGATSLNIVRSFVSRGLMLTSAGLAAGSLLAAIVLPVLTPLLYGLRPRYAPVASDTVAVLVTVAMVASFLPARRASRIDPVSALRKE